MIFKDAPISRGVMTWRMEAQDGHGAKRGNGAF